ncbi:hypothetical protein ACI6Q2_10525 [Chitinophagaceae bacterium LWZ2-11]
MKNNIFKKPPMYVSVKWIMIVCMLCTTIIYPSQKINAQSPVDKMAQKMTDSLAYLQLTDQQKSQALGFNTTAATSLIQLTQKAKQDTTLKGKALAKQVMGVMKQRNTSLKALLTPDQQKLYQAHQIEQMAELQTKMMTTQLDLTDAQVPQVYQINLKETGEMMSDAEKLKAANKKFAKFKAAKALKSDSKDKDKALKKILSPDQYDKYEKNAEEMQAEMKEKMKEKKGG